MTRLTEDNLTNPLKILVKTLPTTYVFAPKIVPLVNSAFEKVGLPFTSSVHAARSLELLTDLGFLQLIPSMLLVRLNPIFKRYRHDN